jgi:radical SAM-linked protein
MHRLRVCYGKRGRLAFLGHLEVTGALERGVRRARLPVAYSQGFNPKAKLAFGPALPVGVAGEREYVDVFLTDWLAASAASEAPADALPEGLPVVGANYVAASAPSLTAAAAAVVYEVAFVGLDPSAAGTLEQGIERLMNMETITVTRRGGPKTYEVGRALLRRPKILPDRDELTIQLWLRMIDQAPVRPDALAAQIAGDLGTATPAEGAQAGAGGPYMRVTRMECYAQQGDALVSLGEAR